MTRRYFFRSSAAAVGSMAVAGCQPEKTEMFMPAKALPAPLHVVATTPILAALVSSVAGELATVSSMVPFGAPVDKIERTGPIESQLTAADVVVTLGLGLEAKLEKSLQNAGEAGAVLCELAGAFPAESLFPRAEAGGSAAGADPHVWLDPLLWGRAIRPIEEMLRQLRPSQAGDVAKRVNILNYEFSEMEKELRRRVELASLPLDTPLATTNAAVRYLGRAAGVPVMLADTVDSREDATLEKLPLGNLFPPDAEKVMARGTLHDLSTLGGLRLYALDLMLNRVGGA